MFKKNKPCNPWATFAYAMLKAALAIVWGYWAITGIQQKNVWLIIASAYLFATCMADCIKLLLRADVESTEYYRKK